MSSNYEPKFIHNTDETSWMENKGTILRKCCLRGRVRLFPSFTTKNYRASTTTRTEKPNASMARVTGSRVV